MDTTKSKIEDVNHSLFLSLEELDDISLVDCDEDLMRLIVAKAGAKAVIAGQLLKSMQLSLEAQKLVQIGVSKKDLPIFYPEDTIGGKSIKVSAIESPKESNPNSKDRTKSGTTAIEDIDAILDKDFGDDGWD